MGSGQLRIHLHLHLIVCCHWLPKRARWSYLAHLGLCVVSRRKNFPESHLINPLLTKLVRSRWLDIGLVHSFVSLWTLTSPLSINTQKKLGQYPAILTTYLVNNPYIQLYLINFLILLEYKK